MRKRKDKKTKLPNHLSVLRLIFIPAVVACLYFPERMGSFLAALFFGLAALTDLLDGFYARRYRVVTPLGKFLDPLADKLLISVTMIMLITLDRIPAWVVMLIIARELAVTGLRGIAIIEGQIIEVSILGKYKTIFQSVALICLCLHHQYFQIDFHIVGMVFLWVALVLTLWSGWMYFRVAKKALI
jgi:CDP-diacylglycerol--glycerol-3-phosphate 3-phosphatidyltransferase